MAPFHDIAASEFQRKAESRPSVSIDLPEFPSHPALADMRQSIERAAQTTSDGEFRRLCTVRANEMRAEYERVRSLLGRPNSHLSPTEHAKVSRFNASGLDAFDLLAVVGWYENVELMLSHKAERQ